LGGSNVNRKVGGLLVGVGGVTAALALLCCVAPWLLAGFLIALGLGFILKDVLLLTIAALGVLVALFGFWLRRKDAKREGGAT
jgi:mannose/fructose/N-acetylgalactosamine-specific phosphotransferase system component IIC